MRKYDAEKFLEEHFLLIIKTAIEATYKMVKHDFHNNKENDERLDFYLKLKDLQRYYIKYVNFAEIDEEEDV